MSKGIGGHTRPVRGESDVWLTPPPIPPYVSVLVMTRIWSNAQAATCLVSSSQAPFTNSTYQSQKVPQVKW